MISRRMVGILRRLQIKLAFCLYFAIAPWHQQTASRQLVYWVVPKYVLYLSNLSCDFIKIVEPQYGMFVWPSAPVLAQYIFQNQDDFRGKHILEVSWSLSFNVMRSSAE